MIETAAGRPANDIERLVQDTSYRKLKDVPGVRPETPINVNTSS